MTKTPELTRAVLRRQVQDRFAAAGLTTAALDARVLAQYVWNASLADIVALETLPANIDDQQKFDRLAAARLAGRSVSRLVGGREFYGLLFKLDASTLDPRADSEVLVTTCLDLFSDQPHRVLDLGTGSGCLIISLLVERAGWHGLAVDLSAQAVRMARINAARFDLSPRLTIRQSSWFAVVTGQYDLIIANPPYIASDDLAGLSDEVLKNDPRRALDGGHDGLTAYRLIAAQAAAYLAPRGRLVLEVGYDQRCDVTAIFTAAGWTFEACRQDLAGHDRCLVFARA